MSVWDAAEKGDLDGVKAAVENGADIEERGWTEGTALHCACLDGHTLVAEYLIERGAEINCRDKDGYLPIHMACWRGHLDTVKLLINKGSDFTSTSNYGTTPLDIASTCGYPRLTDYLTQHGAGNNVIYNEAYFRALEAGEARNTRIPILIVGQDRAGKTSLKKHLLGLPFDSQEPSTNGIEVDVVELTDENAEEPWKKKEIRQFFISAGEAEKHLVENTAQLLTQRRQNLESEKEPHKQSQPDFQTKHDFVAEENGSSIGESTVKSLSPQMIRKIEVFTKTDKSHESPAVKVFIHDLAGQSVFYDTHFCFLKTHCPYLLVLDLNSPLEEPAQPRFKFQSMDVERNLNNPLLPTNLDYFLSWLTVLARLKDFETDMFSGEFPEFELPPVVIALTHSDEFKRDITEVKERIQDVLTEKAFTNVFPDVFVIDNTLPDRAGDEIRRLRRKLYSLCTAILKKQRPMPVRWLEFEQALSHKMEVEGLKYIPVEDARTAAQSCMVKDVGASITFLHHQGVIVHHPESPVVVLNPPWLMNLFTAVITVPQEKNPRDAVFYKLLKKGILMQEYFRKRVDGKLLEDLMKQFSLICSWNHEGKAAFIVPSVAPLMEEGVGVQEKLSNSTISSVFIGFSCLHVPIGLYTRFQTNVLNMCREDLLSCTPRLYCNYTLLSYSRKEGRFDVYLVKIPGMIKVGVVPQSTCNPRPLNSFVSYVKNVLKDCIQKVKEEEPVIYKNITATLKVKCSVCYGETDVCIRHGKFKCDRDECGHFWSLDKLQSYAQSPVCNYGSTKETRVFSLERVNAWLNTERQLSDEATYERDEPSPSRALVQELERKQTPPDRLQMAEIAKIAERISNRWVKLAYLTNKFESHEIDNIKFSRYGEDESNKALDILTKYSERGGTRQKLANKLKKLGMTSLSQDVINGCFIDDDD